MRSPRIAYVLPTRDRLETLARTIAGLARLPRHDAQVIVVDNASRTPPRLPIELANGLAVTLLMRGTNEGAAARNAGALAADASCEWIVMLDDDSHPVDAGHLAALRDAPSDVAAVQAEIFLPRGEEGEGSKAAGHQGIEGLRHEAGGLPEVFIGCGVAIRREAFLAAGGYDPSFNYYVEEYDLAAKLMLAGMRITLDRRFQVLHEKTQAGRDMDVILRRLVRNNAWVMRRYAPRVGGIRAKEVRRTIARYGRIAIKERAELGYAHGLLDLSHTYFRQPRREMPLDIWDRFTGKAAAREALSAAHASRPFATAALIGRGKNDHIIVEVLRELGVTLAADEADAEALVIGTLSPGPMLDALAKHGTSPDDQRVIAPIELGPIQMPAAVEGSPTAPSRAGVRCEAATSPTLAAA